MTTATKLKKLMAEHRISQQQLASHLRISQTAVSRMLSGEREVKQFSGTDAKLKRQLEAYFVQRGCTHQQVCAALKEWAAPRANVSLPVSQPTNTNQSEKETAMVLRNQTISPEALEHLGLPRDPFHHELRGADDVYTNKNIRRVRAAVQNAAEFGGFLAVIADSGAGKSVLRKDLRVWAKNYRKASMFVVEPYIASMQDTETKGRILRVGDIIEAVIVSVAPGVAVARTDQARQRQLHRLLQDSARAGNRHIVVIEEAHRLATPTLCSLKNLYEMEDGFSELMSILLIGQTELGWKLAENNYQVREVVQRMSLYRLGTLDGEVDAYLRHKFTRVGAEHDNIMAPDAVAEVEARLRARHTAPVRGQRNDGPRSLCTPQAINNLVSGAINKAYELGESHVTAALVAAAAVEEA